MLTLTGVAYYAQGALPLHLFLGLVMVMWGVFLVPPLLDRWVNHRKQEVTNG